MKAKIYLIVLLFINFPAFGELGLRRVETRFYTQLGSEILAKNIPPTLDQKREALCYAYVATNLVKHLVCRNEGEQCYRKSGLNLSEGHMAALSTEEKNRISVGGDYYQFLRNLVGGNLRVASKSCQKYGTLSEIDEQLRKKDRYAREYKDDYLSNFLQERLGESVDCVDCLAAIPLDIIAKNEHHLRDLLAALSAVDRQTDEIVFEALVPRECREDGLAVPPVRKITKYYPLNDPEAKDKIYEEIASALSQNYVVPFPLISDSKGGANHIVLVTGIKKVCDFNNCRVVFKVQNSYGEGVDDGWFSASDMIDHLYQTKMTGQNSYYLSFPVLREVQYVSAPSSFSLKIQNVQNREEIFVSSDHANDSPRQVVATRIERNTVGQSEKAEPSDPVTEEVPPRTKYYLCRPNNQIIPEILVKEGMDCRYLSTH